MCLLAAEIHDGIHVCESAGASLMMTSVMLTRVRARILVYY